jgi:hypothetical protein
MSIYEHVLEPGSTGMPSCPCGAKMLLSRKQPPDKAADTEIRIYECPRCRHELRLTVWIATEPQAS